MVQLRQTIAPGRIPADKPMQAVARNTAPEPHIQQEPHTQLVHKPGLVNNQVAVEPFAGRNSAHNNYGRLNGILAAS
jgi:hypothetical protein